MKSLLVGFIALMSCAASALTAPIPTASKGTFSNKIRVSWSSVYGATKYKVRYGLNSVYANSSTLITTTSTAINVTGVTAGRKYYFWVLPCDRDGVFWYGSSKWAYGYTSVPHPSITLRVNSVSEKSVALSWTVSGSTPSKFQVYRNTVNNYGTASLIAVGKSGARRYTDTDVKHGTSYYYWLRYYYNGSWYKFSPVKATTWTVSISGPSTLRYGQTGTYSFYVRGSRVRAYEWAKSGSVSAYLSGLSCKMKPTKYGYYSVKIYATYNGKTYYRVIKITP